MGDEVTVRAAESADVRFFYDVNNHPSVRAVSIDTRPIPWEMHEAWYAASLQRPTRWLFVVSAGGVDCGVVRFDVNDDLATISVALSPDSRGRGVGTRAIAAGSEAVCRAAEIRRVEALIRPDNVASHVAFERAGYVAVAPVKQDGIELNRMIWEMT